MEYPGPSPSPGSTISEGPPQFSEFWWVQPPSPAQAGVPGTPQYTSCSQTLWRFRLGNPLKTNNPQPPRSSLTLCCGWRACRVEVHTTSRAGPQFTPSPSPLLHLSEHSHKYVLLILICTKYILFSLQEPQKIEAFLITLEFPLIINLGAIFNKFM